MYYVDLSWTVLLVLAGGEVRLHKKQTIPYSIFFASGMSTPRIYRCHAFSRDIKSPQPIHINILNQTIHPKSNQIKSNTNPFQIAQNQASDPYPPSHLQIPSPSPPSTPKHRSPHHTLTNTNPSPHPHRTQTST